MPDLSYTEHKKQQKYSAIVALLDRPMGAKEIAEHLGVSYYTVKPLLNEMVMNDVLKTSAFKVGGAEQYERKIASNMPMFQHFETKQWLTLKEWLDMMLPLKDGQGTIFDVIKAMPNACWLLLNLARRVELGASDDGDINMLRIEATEMYRKAQNIAKFWEQIIGYEPLWTVDGMRKIAESPDYPADDELNRYAVEFGS